MLINSSEFHFRNLERPKSVSPPCSYSYVVKMLFYLFAINFFLWICFIEVDFILGTQNEQTGSPPPCSYSYFVNIEFIISLQWISFQEFRTAKQGLPHLSRFMENILPLNPNVVMLSGHHFSRTFQPHILKNHQEIQMSLKMSPNLHFNIVKTVWKWSLVTVQFTSNFTDVTLANEDIY